MAVPEELQRLRKEARRLRQEYATVKNAWEKQKDQNDNTFAKIGPLARASVGS